MIILKERKPLDSLGGGDILSAKVVPHENPRGIRREMSAL